MKYLINLRECTQQEWYDFVYTCWLEQYVDICPWHKDNWECIEDMVLDDLSEAQYMNILHNSNIYI